MIVISNQLVIANVDDPPLGTPWIGYENIVSEGSIDATTEDPDFPATNVANPATHLYWQALTNTSDEYLTVTTNFDGELDYLAIAKHNFGTAGITVSVEGKFDDGFSPVEPYVEIVQQTVLDDDTPVIFRFVPQVLTHIRLRMQIGSELPQLAVMYVGALLVLQRSIKVDVDHVPLKYGRRSTIVNGMSESGNFLGRIVLKEFRESTAEFAHFEPAWYRTFFEPFIIASKEIPFFFAWHPITYPLESGGYAWMINDPQPEVSPITDRIAVELQMRGIA